MPYRLTYSQSYEGIFFNGGFFLSEESSLSQVNTKPTSTHVLPAYVCVLCVPGAGGSQKRALGALEVELQVVVSSHVDAGN